MPAMLREPVSAVDAAWLRMDSKTNPMVITSILAFEGRLEDAALDELVARLVANERFRQRLSRKGSVMVTNVPGPPVPLAVAGHALRSIAVWAPTAGHIAVGVSLVSYAGKVRLSIASDTALVPDPESIVHRFERDVDELLAAGSR